MDDTFTIGWADTGATSTGILRLTGDIDIQSCDELRDLLLDAIGKATFSAVTVDLSETTFIDSEALSALIVGCNAARTAGIGFRLSDATGVVARVLQVTGLTGLGHEPGPRPGTVQPPGLDNLRILPSSPA